MVAAATVQHGPKGTARGGKRGGAVGPSCSIARPQPRETGRGEEEVARSGSGAIQGGR